MASFVHVEVNLISPVANKKKGKKSEDSTYFFLFLVFIYCFHVISIRLIITFSDKKSFPRAAFLAF